MKRITFGEKVIASAGYDAQRAWLELEFTQTGKTILFISVPEDVWYGLQNTDFPDKYFRRHIRNKFEEYGN